MSSGTRCTAADKKLPMSVLLPTCRAPLITVIGVSASVSSARSVRCAG